MQSTWLYLGLHSPGKRLVMVIREKNSGGMNASPGEVFGTRSIKPNGDCAVDQGLLFDMDWKSVSRLLFLFAKK